ncbi:MAG: hypothetical protein QF580_05185, partial [Gammaproteobacteria bacterium]|nr:hypothetical protein [Gammaproteobacteria bacterium]
SSSLSVRISFLGSSGIVENHSLAGLFPAFGIILHSLPGQSHLTRAWYAAGRTAQHWEPFAGSAGVVLTAAPRLIWHPVICVKNILHPTAK